MANYEGKNLSKGQKIASEVIGEIAGIGAGSLIGAAAFTLLQATNVGKIMKVICGVGCVGITWCVQDNTAEATKTAMSNIFSGINDLQKLFGHKKVNDKTTIENVEVTIE